MEKAALHHNRSDLSSDSYSSCVQQPTNMAPATSDVESASKGEDVWINDAEVSSQPRLYPLSPANSFKPQLTTSSHDAQKQQGRSSITSAHAQYLTARHGTAELDPLPDATDADPYNWPRYKKNINLLLVAFHAFMATFTAASIQSAFENISEDLDVTIQQASYLTSLVICILGVAPLFWRPLSDKYGRRPVFMISLVCSLVGNVGCACSPTYATMGLCRAITAFFISPAAAIGSAVVQETFFKSQRARCMGVWTMFVTLGVPVAPFIFGFVALRVGYRWIYWTLAIVSIPFCQWCGDKSCSDHLLTFVFARPTGSNSSSTSSSAPKAGTSGTPTEQRPPRLRLLQPERQTPCSTSAPSTQPPLLAKRRRIGRV